MVYHGHVQNGVVVLDSPASLPEGIEVRIEPLPDRAAPDCFAGLRDLAGFDPAVLSDMRGKLTAEQYEALLAIASQGGPDVDAIARLRAASFT